MSLGVTLSGGAERICGGWRGAGRHPTRRVGCAASSWLPGGRMHFLSGLLILSELMYSSGKDVTVNRCSHGGHSHFHYYLSRACLLGFPIIFVPTRLHMGRGTVRTCLKALQPAVPGRSDLPETAMETGVHAGKPLFSRMLQPVACSGTFLQSFQAFGSLLIQLGSLHVCCLDHGLYCALSHGHLVTVAPLQYSVLLL